VRDRLSEVERVLLKGDLVPKLEPAVVFRSLLDCVVRQVDDLVEVLQVVLSARCPQVAVVVNVPLQPAVDRRDYGEAADVKLAPLVQGGPLDVLLEDKRVLGVPTLRVD